MNKLVKFIVLLILISNTLYSQSVTFNWPVVDDVKIEKSEYLDNFLQINKKVAKKHTLLKEKNINIDSLANVYSTKIEDASSKEEYFKILFRYFHELKNTHSNFIFRKYSINCSTDFIENKLFMNRVDEKIFIENGVKKQDEIIKIDNMPVIEWMENQMQYYSFSKANNNLKVMSYRIFNSFFKEDRTFEIMTTKGLKIIYINFDSIFPRIQYKSATKSLIINDSIAYINIYTMNSNRVLSGSVLNDFLSDLDSLRDFPNLIIDIRQNGGGLSHVSNGITEYLIKKTIIASDTKKKLQAQPNRYRGTIYVLIGGGSCSAAETFSLNLLETGDVTFIGSESCGDSGNRPNKYRTKYGVYYRIPTRRKALVSVKGFPMEGIGIKPHIIVKQTVDDYLKGKDTVLDYAVNYILKNK